MVDEAERAGLRITVPAETLAGLLDAAPWGFLESACIEPRDAGLLERFWNSSWPPPVPPIPEREHAGRFEIMTPPTLLPFTDGVPDKRMTGSKARNALLEQLEEFFGAVLALGEGSGSTRRRYG